MVIIWYVPFIASIFVVLGANSSPDQDHWSSEMVVGLGIV